MELDKDEIIQKAIRKDKKAFVQLCEMIVSQVLYMCKYHLGNWEDAEDATQEVFIHLQRNISKIKSPAAFKAWLNKTVVYTCNNIRRKTMKQSGNTPIEEINESLLVDALNELPQEYVETVEMQERLIELLDNLPYRHKQCILLHYYQKLSYAEIAEIMDCKQDDVRNILRRARQILKIELEDEIRSTDQSIALPLISIAPALEKAFIQISKATVPAEKVKACLEATGTDGALTITAKGF